MVRIASVLKRDGDTQHGFYNTGGKYYARRSHKGKTKEYQLWENMKFRSYYQFLKDPIRYANYKNVVVCDEWKDFQDFAKWFHEDSNYHEGWQLDKDILSPDGSPLYSPETCTFVPEEMNKALLNKSNHRGDFPVGVCLGKNGKSLLCRYLCRDKEFSIQRTFSLDEVDQAFYLYKQSKEKYMRHLATKWAGIVDNRVTDYFMNYEVNIDD